MRERLQLLREDRDSGLTLIELLVTMLVFSILIGFVYGLLINVQNGSKDLQSRSDSVGNARLALQSMDRHIRSGNVIYDANDPALAAYPNSMLVYTQANGDERCVQWQVVGGTLRTRSWSTTWQTDGLLSDWGVVARALTGSTAPFAKTSTGLVSIDLLVKAPGDKGNGARVQSSIAGRNTLYGYNPAICSPVPTS